MRIAIDITDVIQVVQSAPLATGDRLDEYHAVLKGPSGHALWSAWEQKKRDDDSQPSFEL